jgi:hypothetical protein
LSKSGLETAKVLAEFKSIEDWIQAWTTIWCFNF